MGRGAQYMLHIALGLCPGLSVERSSTEGSGAKASIFIHFTIDLFEYI